MSIRAVDSIPVRGGNGRHPGRPTSGKYERLVQEFLESDHSFVMVEIDQTIKPWSFYNRLRAKIKDKSYPVMCIWRAGEVYLIRKEGLE